MTRPLRFFVSYIGHSQGLCPPRLPRRAATLLLSGLLVACSSPPSLTPLQPEGGSGYRDYAGLASTRYAIATANPLASEAGEQILQAGGSALDAAIAAQMVLTLVEPQSSGIGGGSFMLHFDGNTVHAFDGRETAPALAHENLFLTPERQPMPFIEAVVGGRSVGVPGTVSMLEKAHRQQGHLPWAQLFEPAIRLAEQGFPVSDRLHTLLTDETHLQHDPEAAAYFFDAQGQPWPVGHRLKNPALAHVLRRLAAEGADALHRGPIARAIVQKVQQHPHNPGLMSLNDLAGYQPRQREALCFRHEVSPQSYRICGFPPPSSAAITVGQILGMLTHTPAAAQPLDPQGLPSPDWLHAYTEAARLAFADRARYLADPDFTPAPAGNWSSLLAPDYLHARAQHIGPRRLARVEAGQPGTLPGALAPMADQPEYGTTHLSVVDAQGRAVAMTSSIEYVFGSKLMVHGFLLNNESTDFSFRARDPEGRPVANRVEPGKRARSSMSPMMVFDEHSRELLLSSGSAGGSFIIHHVAKVIWAKLHWGLDAQAAINLPNFSPLQERVLLESDRFPLATRQALQQRGHSIREADITSGLHSIEKTTNGLFGGADPRREGQVRGQ